jgi:hypothetical protein
MLRRQMQGKLMQPTLPPAQSWESGVRIVQRSALAVVAAPGLLSAFTPLDFSDACVWLLHRLPLRPSPLHLLPTPDSQLPTPD